MHDHQQEPEAWPAIPLKPESSAHGLDPLWAFTQDTSKRNDELYGSWVVETARERKLRQLAETYHTGCEAYDRRVCSGISPETGEAMPLTRDEMGLITHHARTVRLAVIAEGWQLGFAPEEVEEAIRKWVK